MTLYSARYPIKKNLSKLLRGYWRAILFHMLHFIYFQVYEFVIAELSAHRTKFLHVTHRNRKHL